MVRLYIHSQVRQTNNSTLDVSIVMQICVLAKFDTVNR